MKLLLGELLYWGSFLIVPFVALLFIYRKKIHKLVLVILVIGSLFFVWARFLEPQIIIVREHSLDVGFSGKIVLIADTHLGVYKREQFLERVVRVINKQNPDYVMIAGDFTHDPKEGEIGLLFESLSDINVPVYAVLGNHDIEPGSPVRSELRNVLEHEGINFLNNQKIVLENFTLVGMGDHWGNEDDVTLLDTFTEEDAVVVLTHNPDTTLSYANNNADVTLTGHTHCGQVRIPWLYKRAIPTEGPFDKGFTQEKYTKLYITCGLGEVGLPMRLFNPPVIDVLNFK